MPTIIYLPYKLSVITVTTQNSNRLTENKIKTESEKKVIKFNDYLIEAEKKLTY